MSTFITTAPPQTRAEALGRRAVAMIGIATLAAVAVIAFAGLGSDGRIGPLGWTGKAEVFTHPTIKDDRVLTGTLRNDGTHPLRYIGRSRNSSPSEGSSSWHAANQRAIVDQVFEAKTEARETDRVLSKQV